MAPSISAIVKIRLAAGDDVLVVIMIIIIITNLFTVGKNVV